MKLCSSFRRSSFAIAIGTFIVGMLVAPSIAGAVAIGGTTPFAMTPTPTATGLPRSYFSLAINPGSSVTDHLVVSNLSHSTENLKIGTAVATTAPNSGSAYGDAFGACSGVACWISGLPPTVSLAPGTTQTLTFNVNVPVSTPPQQYLAGISGEPEHPSAPVSIGSNGSSRAQAIIINEVTVGVGVTVGGLKNLTSRLVVEGISGSYVGTTPRILVHVKNVGQTYVHGSGSATCTTNGTTLSFPVSVNTILPGDTAIVPVNATGLAANTLASCDLSLPYGGSLKASWRGSVPLPPGAAGHEVHIGNGVYATLPTGLPKWAIALFITAGVIIVALLTALIISRRNRHRLALPSPPEE